MCSSSGAVEPLVWDSDGGLLARGVARLTSPEGRRRVRARLTAASAGARQCSAPCCFGSGSSAAGRRRRMLRHRPAGGAFLPRQDRRAHWAAICTRTTDWAKGAHWLVDRRDRLCCGAGFDQLKFGGTRSPCCCVAARLARLPRRASPSRSVILHSIKIVLGRRRPRDELELGLYGWRPIRLRPAIRFIPFRPRADDFLRGRDPRPARCRRCAVLWFAVAIYLALTRALLNSHFLSDVLVGRGDRDFS